MATKTNTNPGNTMNTETLKTIAAANSFENLAAACRAFADDNGIELSGTYAQMARRCPAHTATFRAFAARCRALGA